MRWRPRSEHQINERMLALWTRLLGIFTLILAIVSCVTAYILYETDRTSRLRDRAFVYFGDPQIRPYPATSEPIIWALGISIQNVGNLPARRVTIRYACPYAAHSGNIKDPFPLAKWRGAEFGNIVGPRGAFVLQGCEVPIDVINDARKSTQDVFYVVEIRYTDGFELGKLRVTQMSRILRFDQWGGMSLGFIGPHNCSDEDCPE
jgi:hypothetical protein